MTSMNHNQRRGRVVIGVDTHKHIHVAVALDDFGGVLGKEKFTADTAGYGQLIDWSMTHGHLLTFAIEGTGSYGAGLTAAVRRRDIGVVEVMRTDRRDRRLRGKSDFLDAENAARAVLAGHADAVPKTADGLVEMIRTIKVAKDVAVKARTSAMISLKAVLVNAPATLREQLQPLSKMALIHRCAGLRPGSMTTVEAATKHTLRSIARRWEQLNDEITPTKKCSPNSPQPSHRSSALPSASAPTPPPKCSSSPATTPSESAQSRPGLGSAAWHPSRRPQG